MNKVDVHLLFREFQIDVSNFPASIQPRSVTVGNKETVHLHWIESP